MEICWVETIPILFTVEHRGLGGEEQEGGAAVQPGPAGPGYPLFDVVLQMSRCHLPCSIERKYLSRS